MENLFLVVNPKSGLGKMKTELFKVCETLTKGGYRVTLHITARRGDATEEVKNLGNEFSTIVVCGGDGTLNEVLTGVMQNQNSYRIGYPQRVVAGTHDFTKYRQGRKGYCVGRGCKA